MIPLILIGSYLILAIIVVVFIFMVVGFLSQMISYLVGIAIIGGLIYVILLVSKGSSSNQTQHYEDEEPTFTESIVEKCKSMYDNTGDIKECIERGN